MEKALFINEDAFQNARNRGVRKLHSQMILLLLFLILFFIVGYVSVQSLFNEQAVMVQYGVQVGIELLLWILSILFLWQETKMGRILFSITSILSLYGIYSFVMFYGYEVKDIYEQLIRILFTILYICKSITLLMSTYRLYQKPIAYIWERFESTGKEAQEHDEALIQKLFMENDVYEIKKQSDQKINRRALHNLRLNTILLILYVYGFLLLFYIVMLIIRYYFPSDTKGIEYVQRYLLLASLFTALIWSLPAIGMFLNKKWVKYTIIVAWVLEILRFSTSLSDTLNTFMTQHYGLPSLVAIVTMELLRYIVLAKFTISFIKDPFIQAYWAKQKK